MAVTDQSHAANGARSPGFHHDVGFYSSDEEFRDLILPFAAEGLEGGEALVFAYDPYKVDLLRGWLPDSDAVTYVEDTSPYARPALALRGWAQLVSSKVAEGFARVRIAGNVPHPGYGMPYAGWDRYEMAIDRAWEKLPAWARCLYDTRLAPPDVISRARRLHQHVAEQPDGGHPRRQDNPHFEQVSSLSECLPPVLDEMERGEPLVELLEPTPAVVRKAVEELAPAHVGEEAAADLCLAASEAVANAILHGTPPVTAQLWGAPAKFAVHVRDGGSGPADPLVGLVTPSGAPGSSGRGMWIIHHLALETGLHASDAGFVVRVFAGPPASSDR